VRRAGLSALVELPILIANSSCCRLQ